MLTFELLRMNEIMDEPEEAIDLNIHTTQEEISREITKFACRLRDCMNRYERQEIPVRMLELDDVKSELTQFNYSRLFFYENNNNKFLLIS